MTQTLLFIVDIPIVDILSNIMVEAKISLNGVVEREGRTRG